MNYYVMTGMKKRITVRGAKSRIDTIIDAVSFHFKIPVNELLARNRERGIAEARFAVMYLSRYMYDISKTDIAKRLRMDHTTVIHGIKRCKMFMETEPEYRNSVNAVQSLIQ